MNSFVFEPTASGLIKARDWLKAGHKVLCPRCRSELVVTLDADAERRNKCSRGVYCPRDPSHVRLMIDTRPRELIDAVLRPGQES